MRERRGSKRLTFIEINKWRRWGRNNRKWVEERRGRKKLAFIENKLVEEEEEEKTILEKWENGNV